MLTIRAISLFLALGTFGAFPGKPTVDQPTLSDFLCKLKKKVQYRHAPWDTTMCDTVSSAVLRSSKRHDVHPLLIVGTMTNESELVAGAMLAARKFDGKPLPTDAGLMGIRCILHKGKCRNSGIRGMTLKEVLDPATNIEIGTRRLAYWRKHSKEKVTVWRRGRRYRELVPCSHRNHAFWAHYNHGERYFASGRARHYPHRVGVLYGALVRAFHQEMPKELLGPITVKDRYKRPRSIDKPVGRRYKRLVRVIAEAAREVPALSQVTLTRVD